MRQSFRNDNRLGSVQGNPDAGALSLGQGGECGYDVSSFCFATRAGFCRERDPLAAAGWYERRANSELGPARDDHYPNKSLMRLWAL